MPKRFTSDIQLFKEAAVRGDGSLSIKLIAPGWGSSGYYSKEVLQRDGAIAFPAGTQMYWDHPTSSEEWQRPERSLRDLAGVLLTEAQWQDDGKAGPGLYAETKVYSEYQHLVDEMASDIGMSVYVSASAAKGEIEGRQGTIITALVRDPGNTVDFVTRPGAGGQIIQLFESLRRHEEEHTEGNMSELDELRAKLTALEADQEATKTKLDEATKVKETLEAENARYREAALLNQAQTRVSEQLSKADLPDITVNRLRESLVKNVPVKDGALDTAALDATVTQAVEAEREYIKNLTGNISGVFGMGTSGGQSQGGDDSQADTQLEEAFVNLLGDKERAKEAARGRS